MIYNELCIVTFEMAQGMISIGFFLVCYINQYNRCWEWFVFILFIRIGNYLLNISEKRKELYFYGNRNNKNLVLDYNRMEI